MKDKIGGGCMIAIDSVNAVRDKLSTLIANLRYASDQPTADREHIRANALGSALVDLELAKKRLGVLHEFVEGLREEYWSAFDEAAGYIPEAGNDE